MGVGPGCTGRNPHINRFRTVFSNRHVVLPVIHVVDVPQAIRNAEIALNAGADGVFLINHDLPYTTLLDVYAAVSTAFSDWWIGVNCLDLDAAGVFQHIGKGMAGVWVDNAMIHEDLVAQPEADAVLKAQRVCEWHGLYFGGVAFKYQRPVMDVARAAQLGAGYMDVVTTSGPATGQAAAPEKIRRMKQAIGDHPLAIASGITPENVTDYLAFADCFLVATGICNRIDELDESRTSALIQIVRASE